MEAAKKTNNQQPKKSILRNPTMRDLIILQNLQRMFQNSRKKRLAQLTYYMNNQLQARNGVPIRSRIGNKKQFYFPSQYQPTKHLQITKQHLKKVGLFTKKYRQQYHTQPYTKQLAEKRMLALRQSFENEDIIQRSPFFNKINMPRHSVKKSLTQSVQNEIKEIQMQCSGSEDIPNLPIYIKNGGTTTSTLHYRFSNLP